MPIYAEDPNDSRTIAYSEELGFSGLCTWEGYRKPEERYPAYFNPKRHLIVREEFRVEFGNGPESTSIICYMQWRSIVPYSGWGPTLGDYSAIDLTTPSSSGKVEDMEDSYVKHSFRTVRVATSCWWTKTP